MASEPAYTLVVEPVRCWRCSARPAYVVTERQRGDQILLCKRHLEPWLEERRWAVVRMAAPLGWDASKEDWEAYTTDNYANAVRVIYTEKEN